MSRRGGRALKVLQPEDQVACPLLLAGVIKARICAIRQHARATGSPRGARYYPCSYLIHGEQKRTIAFRCEQGRETLYRLPKEWWPENWKPKHSDPRLVARHSVARREWILSRLPGDRIDGRSV